MAVYQHRIAKTLARGLKQSIKRLVIRLVEIFNAVKCFREGNSARINQLALTDQTRHRTKPASDARRLGVHERRQRLGEHARIELIGFTIHIQKSPREMRLEQGRPEPHRRSKQVIDVTVFRMANAQGIQTRRFDEGMRVIASAMRGIKDERNALFRRSAYLEGRYQTKIALQTHSSPVLDRNSQAIRQRSTLIT